MNSFTLLKIAHWSMAVTFAVGVLIIYFIYGAELNLSIPVLVFLHIFLVIMATIFKISYVTRLAALKQMGRAAH